MVRLRAWVPDEQFLVQLVQGAKTLTLQSTGQGWAMQLSDSSRAGHLIPLYRSATRTLRPRLRVPPPHDTVHKDQGSHLFTWQSTGHNSLLQVLVSCTGGHDKPFHIERC
jgi:hypothetical protein